MSPRWPHDVSSVAGLKSLKSGLKNQLISSPSSTKGETSAAQTPEVPIGTGSALETPEARLLVTLSAVDVPSMLVN